MEIVRTLGQVPLMFLGGFLVVLALAAVWGVAQLRRRRTVAASTPASAMSTAPSRSDVAE
jgi:hypothetical protein